MPAPFGAVPRYERGFPEEALAAKLLESATRSSISVRATLSLVEAVQTYVAKQNASPKPFIWTAKTSHVVAKVKRDVSA